MRGQLAAYAELKETKTKLENQVKFLPLCGRVGVKVCGRMWLCVGEGNGDHCLEIELMLGLRWGWELWVYVFSVCVYLCNDSSVCVPDSC